jgi:chromosome segregation ATPase
MQSLGNEQSLDNEESLDNVQSLKETIQELGGQVKHLMDMFVNHEAYISKLHEQMHEMNEKMAEMNAKMDKKNEEYKNRITLNEYTLTFKVAKDIKLMKEEQDEMKTELKEQKNRMCDVSYALQELAASLFNQKTQKQSWRELRDIFIHDGGYDNLTEPLVNTSKWRYPTTRQGDELEERMNELEEKLSYFGTLFPSNISSK